MVSNGEREEPLTHHCLGHLREIHLGPIETCYVCTPQRRAEHDRRYDVEKPGQRPS